MGTIQEPQAAWGLALSDYRSKRTASDAMPLGTSGEDAAIDLYCAAMDHLIVKLPAPGLGELLIKAELAHQRCQGFGHDAEYWEAVLADLRRLAGHREVAS